MVAAQSGLRRLLVRETDPAFLAQHGVPALDVATAIGRSTLPPRFVLPNRMTPARNQGAAGTCCTFGVMSCLEYFHQRDLSEAHLTHWNETTFGECLEGADLGQMMVSARREGAVDEYFWPYDETQICWAHPPNIGHAPRHSFAGIESCYLTPTASLRERIDSLLASARIEYAPRDRSKVLKVVLSVLQHPIAVAVPVWFSFEGEYSAGWDFGPHVTMPTHNDLAVWLSETNRSPPGIAGWHVIALTGFDDSTQRFYFKNSWGHWWGTDGFGTILYEYIDAFSREAMHGWV